MITKLIFWLIIILVIIGVVNNTIIFELNNNLIITIDYTNFIDNTANIFNNIYDFFADLFASDEVITDPNQ